MSRSTDAGAALRWALFDLDGTLKEEPDPYLFIHGKLGTLPVASQFPEMYRRGEIDSDEWLRRDVALWRGVTRQALAGWLREIPYVPGAVEAVSALRDRGVACVTVSSGLQLHVDQVRDELGLQWGAGNRVLFDADGRCTGEVAIDVHETDKAAAVAPHLREWGAGPDACVAVGNGEGDLSLFALCRLGVAIRPASEAVRAAAGCVLPEPGLTWLLPSIERLAPGWLGRMPDG